MIRFNNGTIEIPLSEVIEVDGNLVQALKPLPALSQCEDCFFYKRKCVKILCTRDKRIDGLSIQFRVVKEKEEKK